MRFFFLFFFSALLPKAFYTMARDILHNLNSKAVSSQQYMCIFTNNVFNGFYFLQENLYLVFL